jgi:hypothetical protein
MSDEVTKAEAASLAQMHEAKMQAERDRQYEHLKDQSIATFRAVNGRPGIRSEEQWAETNAKASDDYRTGRFLMEELGARRFLDPAQVAVLSHLRARLAEQHDPEDAAQMMLIDVAVLSYQNVLRLQGWIGNMSLIAERELFGQEPLRVLYGDTRGVMIEDKIKQLEEKLYPLLDRANRMMVRNLKALDDLHRGLAPSVSVKQADQVNVGHQQVNSVRRRRGRWRKTPKLQGATGRGTNSRSK